MTPSFTFASLSSWAKVFLSRLGVTYGLAVARFKQISPVAWQHVNFAGRYEFRKTPEHIDLDAMVEALA
ncbi:MAG: transposase [Deinococcota bacterium]|jgi:hypothetical protein|nr:transposase [Deinococcota bacterium]